jgi:hypothetical protein
MTSTPGCKPPRKSGSSKAVNDELRRERELVRSAGMISRRTMAMAFGIVFLLLGVGLTLSWNQWQSGVTLALLGAISIGWSIHAMCTR